MTDFTTMDINEEAILEKFPLKIPRDGQIECISKILQAFKGGKKYALIEAPTGAGKSAIGLTVSRFFKDSYYLTSAKQLQSQLINDFGSKDVVDLKGRNAYECNYWDNRAKWIASGDPLPQEDLTLFPKPFKAIGCDIGVCKTRDNQAKLSICTQKSLCPYWNRVEEAQNSQLAVMNFKSFLYQTTFANNFDNRELLIVDESHRAEPELLDFISLSIMDTPFAPLRWPKLDSAEEYAEFIRDKNILDIVEQKERYARYANNTKEADEWANMKFKLGLFLNAGDTHWISHYKEIKDGKARIVELKPIFLEKYAHQYLFDKSKYVLMMSATILSASEMQKMLTIDPDDCYAYRMRNRFPKKNRPIMVHDVGSMSYNKKAETLPKLLNSVYEICRRHLKHRGIIHTHNFEIANRIIAECPSDISSRILYQGNFLSKEEMLEIHAKQPNSIIVAPAMHEGLDLKGDLSRFQIIAKVPYPSLGDNPQLKARMEVSPDYYNWLTALKLVQSYGRSVRSEDDWAITYVLDTDFKRFVHAASAMLPDWFTEAIM